jgi:Tol biopolymer transport system component
MTPLRFPPDSLLATFNWMWHGTPVFSPDLKEIHWSKYDRIADLGKLVYIKYNNNNWSSMQYAPFGNQSCFESCPVYSFSGDTLFFSSLRQGGFFFRTCRTSSGWTTPEPLNIPIPQGYAASFEFSMTRNGTIYFALVDTTFHTDADIYKTTLINGEYQIPVNLGPVINSDSNDLNPYIDPDERFIIFASKRPGGYGIHDLYISKRMPDNTWNSPLNLGPVINSNFEDVMPNVTPDNLYFFFVTAKSGDIGYNPYWISTQYIYNLIRKKYLDALGSIPSWSKRRAFPALPNFSARR